MLKEITRVFSPQNFKTQMLKNVSLFHSPDLSVFTGKPGGGEEVRKSSS